MSEREATFNPTSFAQGRFRRAYKGTWTAPSCDEGKTCVVKEWKEKYAWKESDWEETVKCAEKAKELAKKFNKATATSRPITYTNVHVMRVIETCDDSHPKLNEYVTCEDYISGEFEKWCNNYDYISPSAKSLASFAHWSWHYTGGEVMVADLQGVRKDHSYLLTDPAILSMDQSYGDTDTGVEGMAMFFLKHKECRVFCDGLPKPTLDQFKGIIPEQYLRAARLLGETVQGSTTYQHELRFPPQIREAVKEKMKTIAVQ